MTKSMIMNVTLASSRLNAETDLNILFPYSYSSSGKGTLEIGKPALDKLQVLYLIHGGTDDYSCWVNHTMLSEFAQRYPGLMIVMPTIYDFHSVREKEDYFGYAAEELPAFIESNFPVSTKREDRFIAGLSMGGYFAYRIAMAFPDRYCCVGSFSSPLDIEEDMRIRHPGATDYPSPSLVRNNPERDLFVMIDRNLREGVLLPDTFQTCGTEDMTYPLNLRMREYLNGKKLPHTYKEWKGNHTWKFWNESIEKFLEWLPLKQEGE